MKKVKKLLAMVLALLLSMSCLAGCSDSGTTTGDSSAADDAAATENTTADGGGTTFETATYTLNEPMPESDTDPYYILSSLFAEKVNEKTNGAVTINIYTNGQLGSGSDAALGVETGTIDFNVDSTNVFSSEYPKLAICDLPYLFDDVQEAIDFCSSEYMDEMKSEMSEKLGVELLAFGDGGFRAVWSNKGNIYSVDDYDGLKIRVPDVPIYVDTFNAVGANSTPMSGSEVFTSLQQGTIDACEVPLSVGLSQGFAEATKYVTMDNHLYNLLSIQCSSATWSKMSPELQAVMQEAAAEAQTEQIQKMASVDEQVISEIEAAGVTYVSADEIDFTGIREAVQPVYDSWREQIGADFYDNCMAWLEQERG